MLPACGSSFDIHRWRSLLGWVVIIERYSGDSRLARIIHDGSLRNRGVAWRDGRVEARGPEAYLKQYVEGPSGEPARLHAVEPACRLVVAKNSRLQQKRS